MLKLSESEVKEIAQQVNSGRTVFIHKQTSELVTYVTDSLDIEEESEMYEKVRQNPNDYLQIKGMTSEEAYKVRENFIETVESKSLKAELKACLSGKKEKFANFKHRVRNSKYEQKWFDFELQAQIAHTKEQITIH